MITSRDNARVKRWAKLAQDGRYRRAQGRAIIEGPHLLASFLQRGGVPRAVMASESGLRSQEIRSLAGRLGREPVMLADKVFRAIADADTPQGLAAEIDIPAAREAQGSCAFLEGIQDAGNVGAIIRSAAAFGLAAVVVDQGCADPWSPKALRAGMGGHFGLSIRSVAELKGELRSFPGRLLCTVTGDAVSVGEADLGGRIGWVLGSEGRGISPALRQLGTPVRVPMAAGTESLAVAAAAAICFHAAFRP